MKRIIPIICIIVGALSIAISAIGLVMISVSIKVHELSVVTIPVVIVGTVVSVLSIGIDSVFFKNLLCRIALFMNVAAFVFSVASSIIWFVAL